MKVIQSPKPFRYSIHDRNGEANKTSKSI